MTVPTIETPVVPTDSTETPTIPTVETAPPSNSNLPEGWMDNLNPELQSVDGLSEIKTFDELVGKMHTAEKLGMKEDMWKNPETDEDWGEFYGRLGKPESADQYEFTQPEGAKEAGLEMDNASLNEWKGKFHELNLTQTQAKELFGFYNGRVMDSQKSLMEEQKVSNEQGMTILKDDFAKRGMNFDNAMKEADKIATELDVKSVFEERGIYDLPVVKNLLLSLVEGTLEDGTLASASTGKAGSNQYTAEIRKILDNGESPYWDGMHVNHEATVQKVNELRKKEQMFA